MRNRVRRARFIPIFPPEIETIVKKALEKSRELRYQQVAEIRADLQRLKRDTDSGTASSRAWAISETQSGRSGARWPWVIAALALAGAIGAGGYYVRAHRGQGLGEKDTIVLADFDNHTGDPVFDDALKQAFATEVEQSPFLNVLSDRKVGQIRRMMGQEPGRLTPEVGREVCQRAGSKAILSGMISNLGSHYLLELSAVSCATGDAVAKEQGEATSKEDVLKVLSHSCSKLRAKLGESLPSLQKFDMPAEATTSSLEAWKNYSVAIKVSQEQGEAPSIPFLKRAIELDPNFAAAYASLALRYGNMEQPTLALQYATKAYELRDRVSEREKLRISSDYFSARGEIEKEMQIYELWISDYPRDTSPHINLGANYSGLGQTEKALEEQKKALELNPENAVAYGDVISKFIILNRLADADAALRQAAGHKIDTGDLRQEEYALAFLRGDAAKMKEQVDWATGRPGDEDSLLYLQADTEGFHGRMGKAREYTQRAVESAMRNDSKETAAAWQIGAAVREAEIGNVDQARKDVARALAMAPGRDVKLFAALTLARCGDVARATALADELKHDYPTNTLLQVYWLPTVRASIAISKGNPALAISELEVAAPYELSDGGSFLSALYPAYVRGLARLRAKEGTGASAEFQKMLDHPGSIANYVTGALARLQIGRAYAMAGDTTKAKIAYQDFFGLWKDADPDVPELVRARREFGKL